MTMFVDREKFRGRWCGEGGFTLIEILVVITIIALIMSLVGPRVLNYLSESKVKAARIQIQSFSSALDLLYLDAGRYPSTAEGLNALVKPASGMPAWNGPYLKGGNVRTIPGAIPMSTDRRENAANMRLCRTGRMDRRAGPGRRRILSRRT